MWVCQKSNCNSEPLPEAGSCKGEGNGKLANMSAQRRENLQRQIHRPMCCFALFMVKISKTEMEIVPAILGI